MQKHSSKTKGKISELAHAIIKLGRDGFMKQEDVQPAIDAIKELSNREICAMHRAWF